MNVISGLVILNYPRFSLESNTLDIIDCIFHVCTEVNVAPILIRNYINIFVNINNSKFQECSSPTVGAISIVTKSYINMMNNCFIQNHGKISHFYIASNCSNVNSTVVFSDVKTLGFSDISIKKNAVLNGNNFSLFSSSQISIQIVNFNGMFDKTLFMCYQPIDIISSDLKIENSNFVTEYAKFTNSSFYMKNSISNCNFVNNNSKLRAFNSKLSSSNNIETVNCEIFSQINYSFPTNLFKECIEIDQNITIYHNHKDAIASKWTECHILVTESEFIGLTSMGNGGAISLNEIVIALTLEMCTFTRCRAVDRGGALFSTNVTDFNSKRICASNCVASRGSAIFSIGIQNLLNISLSSFNQCPGEWTSNVINSITIDCMKGGTIDGINLTKSNVFFEGLIYILMNENSKAKYQSITNCSSGYFMASIEASKLSECVFIDNAVTIIHPRLTSVFKQIMTREYAITNQIILRNKNLQYVFPEIVSFTTLRDSIIEEGVGIHFLLNISYIDIIVKNVTFVPSNYSNINSFDKFECYYRSYTISLLQIIIIVLSGIIIIGTLVFAIAFWSYKKSVKERIRSIFSTTIIDDFG